MTRAAQLAGWMPIRFYWQHAEPFVDWCDMGAARLTDPFFTQTVERALQQPFSLLFRPQTPARVLMEVAASVETLPPTGFIFHLSRCGSTVISRMLAALAQNVVISEAGPIDSVLRANFRRPVTDEQRTVWLKAMIAVLGQRRAAAERHYFVKFDGWHTLNLSLIRRAFPAVPWLFVYRAPVEVMASHLRRPAGWMRPGDLHPHLLGLDGHAALGLRPEQYYALVLARICQAALQHLPDARVRLVNHRQLPGVLDQTLFDFFGVAYTAAEVAAMRRTIAFHAKEPTARYVDDSAAKRDEVTAEVRQLTEQLVGPFYEQLELVRAAGEQVEARGK
ncbi:MAG TPA: hypothetical protein VF525_12235 [Pyrinomonadaceae bacterium]|jgi:gluconate kinase